MQLYIIVCNKYATLRTVPEFHSAALKAAILYQQIDRPPCSVSAARLFDYRMSSRCFHAGARPIIFLLSLLSIATGGMAFSSGMMPNTHLHGMRSLARPDVTPYQTLRTAMLPSRRKFASTIKAQIKKETKNGEHKEINLDWAQIQLQASLFTKMALPYFKYVHLSCFSKIDL
jgi:hypothetical protein